METYNPAKKIFGKNMARAQKTIETLEPIKERLKQKVRNGFCLDFGNAQGCDMKKVLAKLEEWNKKFRSAYGNNCRRPLPKKLNSSLIESDMKNILSKNDENCKSKLPIKTSTTTMSTKSTTATIPTMATSTMETTTSPITTTITARTLSTSTKTKTMPTSMPAPTSKPTMPKITNGEGNHK